MQAPDHNPYAAPAVDELGPELHDDDLSDATTGQRFLTFILDYVGIMVVSFGVGLASVAIDPSGKAIASVPDFVFGLVIMTFYYVGFEATLGRTPGKLLAGTRVVASNGGAPSMMQIFGRTLARFVPFEAFSAFGGGQMWHDSWSSTRVIKTR